jgi:potassium large conductance calcium-activated channel subfamily M alpha member 1
MACATLITTLQSVQLVGSSYEFPLDNQTYYSIAFYADIVYFVVFLFDYIMILCTNSRAIGLYLISFDSLVVFFAVISVATFMNENVAISVGFLRFPTILRVTRVFRLFDVNPVVIEAWELGLSLVSFFLVNSGIVFAIQYYDSESFYYSNGDISFFDCVYFTVSSISTVGFGDIVAYTNGKFISF